MLKHWMLAAVMTSAALTLPAQADALRDQAAEQFQVIPSMLPAVNNNPITKAKIDLGRALFFDPRLSASGVFSCNSCHNLATGGDDNLETSIGHGWQKGPRNSPTVLNSVLNQAQFWDGRAEDLKAQAKGPIQGSVEMANTPEKLLATLQSMPAYDDWFKLAFPGDAAPVTFDNFAKAVEAFEATLLTPAAPFDRWLEGDDNAMTEVQKTGLSLFMEKGCSSCHSGVNFGGHDYYPFGVVERPGSDILPENDKGRFAVTKTADDEYVFRAAPLRNVALTAPYFHSGKVWDLKQAVAVMGSAQLGDELTDDETTAIASFLTALTGELRPVEYPLLPAETATTPRPTAEVIAQ